MPFLGHVNNNDSQKAIYEKTNNEDNRSWQLIVFKDCDGKIVNVPVGPVIIHNDILGGKNWKQTKAIVSDDGYEVLASNDSNQLFSVIGKEIKKISVDEYNFKVVQARVEGKLLENVKKVYAQVYP